MLSYTPGMRNIMNLGFALALTGLFGCAGEPAAASGSDGSSEMASEVASDVGTADEEIEEVPQPKAGWSAGDTIPSGKASVEAIKILAVHKNGSGAVCGLGKKATLQYKAMLADGSVIDPGTRPFTFRVGAREAIEGWDVVVAKMRVGDSFTILLPMELAYGPSRGDLKFDMELLSFK